MDEMVSKRRAAFAQPAGKQYKFGKVPEEMSEVEQLKKKLSYYEIREELLGKYQEIERKWFQKYS